MNISLDLVGYVVGRWTVIRKWGRDKNHNIMWLCRCTCGTERIMSSNKIRWGDSQSCRCLANELTSKRTFIDLTGQVFNRWTVIRYIGYRSGHASWLCRCECGTEKAVDSNNLKLGHSKSCGCFREDNYKVGEKHHNWRGGRQKASGGYIIIHRPEHPNADKNGYVKEHIFVMSQIIGRPLLKGETVHHKNGVRDDNDPSNLELRANAHGQGQRITDLVPYWKKMLELYEPIIDKLK